MGNNNVTGQQVSEETANGVQVDKTIEPSNGSPWLNSTNSETNNEKDGNEDVNLSKSSKDPIITNAEDKQVASYQNVSSDKIEGLDEKNRGSIKDNTSTREDDEGSNLPKDDEPLRKQAIETTIFSPEVIAPASTMAEYVTSNKDSSISSVKIKHLMHGTGYTSEENIEGNYKPLLPENIEGSLEDLEEARSHETAPMGGNLAGEDTTENLEHGYIEVPTVEDKLIAVQGETTTSTESIVSTYLDADDSEIKEVVIEDKTGQKDSPPDVQLLDGINIETSKNDSIQTQISNDEEEISAISKTTTVKLVIEIDEALEDDKHIDGLRNQDDDSLECTSCDKLYSGKIVAKCQSSLINPTAINDQELGNEQNERVVASRQISGAVISKVEHTGTETIFKEEGVVEKTVTVWNLEDNVAAEKEPAEYDGDFVGIAKVDRKDFTGSYSSSLNSHLILNEVKVQREVNRVNGVVKSDKKTVKEILEGYDKVNTEGLCLHVDAHVVAKEGWDSSNLPMTTTSTPLQFLEDIDEVYITRDTQETMARSQVEQSQQILLEECKVVKLENGEILHNCMQLVGDSSNVGIISTGGINHEKVGTNTRASDFTFETNQKEVTAIPTATGFTAKHNQAKVEVTESTAATGFIVECNQAKVIVGVDTATEEQHPFQTSTPQREAGEETPLLQAGQNIGFFSSTKQHSQVDVEIPMTDIAVMPFKTEAWEESEKSPLLSPKEPSEGDFRIPNHYTRNKKSFQSLLKEGEVGMWSPLKEPESNPESNSMVNSPRSKEKLKPRSSFFTSCMCCTTAKN